MLIFGIYKFDCFWYKIAGFVKLSLNISNDLFFSDDVG